MSRFKFSLPSFLLLALLSSAVRSQIGSMDLEEHPGLLRATLHVQLGDTISPYARQVMEMFRKEWADGEVRFIPTGKPDEALMRHGNYFLSAEHTDRSYTYWRTDQSTRLDGYVTESQSGPTVSNDYFYLAIWTPKEKNDAKWELSARKDVLVRAELFLSSITYGGKVAFTDLGISTPTFARDFLNGSLGRLRNTMQSIHAQVSEGKGFDIRKDMDAKPGLAALKKATLYLPNYWNGPGTYQPEPLKPGGLEDKYFQKLAAAYAHPREWITLPELERRLSSATEDFYYLSYVQSSADKMISVVNGRTGEVLYYNFTAKSYRFNKGDMERLSEKVTKR